LLLRRHRSFHYELKAESQIYRAQDSQTIPVKLEQLLPTVKAVDSVGMTVADMDRSLDFIPKVLSF